MNYEQLKHWIKENTQDDGGADTLIESELESNCQLGWRIKGQIEFGKEILKRWPEEE